MKKQLIAALILIGATGIAQAAGDATAGKGKAAACAACHMADGNSMIPNFPKLAGQHESYIVKQLTEFKAGTRKDATMLGMTAALSPQDMADVGAFFASQSGSIGSANAEKAAVGKTIYQAGNKQSGLSACMACHGPAGKGNAGAKFPTLGGQHSTYTIKQLKDFRSGSRNNVMMNDIAAKMSDAEIDAVAEFIQGLH
ncbi:MAG: cytochrome c4 [Gammaproteobacteria bacterium]|nr:cytochrome c4 [Gammaproteobacteria bacterium]